MGGRWERTPEWKERLTTTIPKRSGKIRMGKGARARTGVKGKRGNGVNNVKAGSNEWRRKKSGISTRRKNGQRKKGDRADCNKGGKQIFHPGRERPHVAGGPGLKKRRRPNVKDITKTRRRKEKKLQ